MYACVYLCVYVCVWVCVQMHHSVGTNNHIVSCYRNGFENVCPVAFRLMVLKKMGPLSRLWLPDFLSWQGISLTVDPWISLATLLKVSDNMKRRIQTWSYWWKFLWYNQISTRYLIFAAANELIGYSAVFLKLRFNRFEIKAFFICNASAVNRELWSTFFYC